MTAAQRYAARQQRKLARQLKADIDRSNLEHVARLYSLCAPHVPSWQDLVEQPPDPSWIALQNNAQAARYATWERGVV